MKYADPRMLFLSLPWALACLIVMLNQNIALGWLRERVSPRFLPGFTRYTPGKLAIHVILIFSAGLSLIWTMAQPYRRGDIREEAAGKDVYFMIDASYSMYAEDTGRISKPDLAGKTRFEAAKALAMETASSLKNDQVGAVTFSGSSITHFMPTADTVTAASLIANFDIHSMRHTGSDFKALLNAFVHAVEQSQSAAVGIILSDGEPIPENQDVSNQLDALHAAGIPVFAVGIGTNEGAAVDLYDPDDVVGRSDNPRIAKTITTRRDPGFLEKIASATGGRYLEPEGGFWADDLARAIDNAPTKEQSLPGELKAGNVDLSGWGLVLFLVFFFTELFWLFPRPASFVATLLFLGLSNCGNSLFNAHRENELGIDKYRESLFGPANSHFELSTLYRTKAGIPLFNLGNNAVQKKEYGKAHSYYQQSIRAEPGEPAAYFNDGVALFLWAEDEIDPKGCFLAKPAELFDQSIARFEEAGTKGLDARENISYVKKRIRDIYELHYSAKDCGQNTNQKTYTSKHAPPPPSQNQQPQNQNSSQDQPQPQSPPQDQNPPQNQRQDPDGSGSGLTENEQEEVRKNLGRIKRDSGSATDFKQTGDQQTPRDKSEIDLDLRW